MIFWVLAAGFAVLAVSLLLPPLLRRQEAIAPRADYDLTVYRDQLAEIDRDLDRGVLNPDQAETARAEIERRLLAAGPTGREAPDRSEPRRPSRALLAALVIGVPAAAFGLYAVLGDPGVPSVPFAQRQVQEPLGADTEHQEVSRLAAQLAARMAENPEDPEGWLLLARTYSTISRYAEAAEAFGQAIARGFDDAEVHAARGEMLIAAADGVIGPEARQAFAAALETDPANIRARYHRGMAMVQDGRLRDALDIWMPMLKEAPAETPWRPVVERQVREAALRLGLDPAKVLENASAPAAAAAPGPSAADVEAVSRMSTEDRTAFVRSMVERLAARLEDEPGDFDGWLRLARAYQVLGEAEQAEQTLAKAADLIRDLPADAPERAALKRARQAAPASQ
jgi:cytochrome c-type biogenesis protein CcmH